MVWRADLRGWAVSRLCFIIQPVKPRFDCFYFLKNQKRGVFLPIRSYRKLDINFTALVWLVIVKLLVFWVWCHTVFCPDIAFAIPVKRTKRIKSWFLFQRRRALQTLQSRRVWVWTWQQDGPVWGYSGRGCSQHSQISWSSMVERCWNLDWRWSTTR